MSGDIMDVKTSVRLPPGGLPLSPIQREIQMMSISITIMDHRFVVTVPVDGTMLDLRRQIAFQRGIAQKDYRLNYKGKLLSYVDCSIRLSQLGIVEDNETMLMSYRIGGSPQKPLDCFSGHWLYVSSVDMKEEIEYVFNPETYAVGHLMDCECIDRIKKPRLVVKPIDTFVWKAGQDCYMLHQDSFCQDNIVVKKEGDNNIVPIELKITLADSTYDKPVNDVSIGICRVQIIPVGGSWAPGKYVIEFNKPVDPMMRFYFQGSGGTYKEYFRGGMIIPFVCDDK